MTAISNKNIAQAIYLASKDHKTEDQFSTKVVKFLAKKKLLFKTPDILLHLNKIINDAEGRIVAKISSVEKISGTQNKKIAQILTRRYSAQEISLVEFLDEKLLGGFKVEVNNEVIDLTIKNKIEKLQKYLISG